MRLYIFSLEKERKKKLNREDVHNHNTEYNSSENSLDLNLVFPVRDNLPWLSQLNMILYSLGFLLTENEL